MNKILVLDDNASIRMLYAEELTEAGYEVITSDNASELMELLERESPDAIVLDIKLADRNGLDLLQDVRTRYHDLAVILCTAYPWFKDDLRSLAADYYVLKSSNVEELKQSVQMALRTGRKFPERTTLRETQQRSPDYWY
jgi:DNA-binding response OmpR family regulator